MTPQEQAQLIADQAANLCENVTLLYSLSLQIQSTEQYETGTEGWLRREEMKSLFDQGVLILNSAFDEMHSW